MDILPSLSISMSFPITSSFLFSNQPSIRWSLCPRSSCDFFVHHALLCLFLLPCSRLVFVLLFHSFLLFFLCSSIYVLPYHCLVLLPAYFGSVASLLPLPPSRPSFPLPSLLPFRCLSVGRWSQSSETPSPVRRPPGCGAVGPLAAQQPCATPHALLSAPLGPCAWSGRCASATGSSTVEPARWLVELEVEEVEEVVQEEQGLSTLAQGHSGS